MKFRILALALLLFGCLLAAGSASAETCRYICSGTILQGSATHCCGTPFQCPDGQTVYPYAYNNGIWRFCGSASAAASTSAICEADATSLTATSAVAVPAPTLTEETRQRGTSDQDQHLSNGSLITGDLP